MPTPLNLFVEVIDGNGTRYKLDANQPPASRPLNLTYSTKIGEGFSTASFQLARRIDQDYADLGLGYEVVITGADGATVFEGFISATPRDLSSRHSISVTVTGWMAHAKDRKFVMPFVDRDTGRWGAMPRERRSGLATSTISFGDFSYSAESGGLVVGLPNQALGAQTITEAWYQAPPGTKVAYVGYRGKMTTLPAGYVQTFASTDARDATAAVGATATLDDTLRLAPLTAGRYVLHQVYSSGTAATPASGSSVQFSKLAAYGNHGLTLHTGDTTEPAGVYASDVIRWIAQNYCPLLDTSGVQSTDYVIQHLAYMDRTFPYDAWLDINKYHLWHLGVWEGKRLDFKPYDFTDYDWEIRTDDPGTTFSPQGPSTESLFNGIEVTYTDLLTGAVETLTPDSYTQLVDSTADNPWNAVGRDKRGEIALSAPALAAQALDLGRAALADLNRPKTPGTITVTGYIRDRAGNRQPVSKVRAGDMISITNFPNDSPRLIVETEGNDEDKSLRLAVDKPFALLDAYLDRQANALQAAGLA